MPKPIQELKKVRLEKLAAIRKLGIDPYPARCRRDQTIARARKMMGKPVAVAGRIVSKRGHGGIIFFDLQDESGQIQLVFKKKNLADPDAKLLPLLDRGDFLEARGKVFKTQSGEISVEVKKPRLLAKSIRPLPSKWHGLKDKEARFRRRYVDLALDPEVRKLFDKKSCFWASVREHLVKNGFLEVETPILEATTGGADARPFVTRHWALDTEFYLRISLELHLKRLLIGGYEKVFEIGRVFRNEGMDAEHLQDYTMMEFYWAYADYEALMTYLESLYKDLVKETTGVLISKRKGRKIDWGRQWERLDYSQIFKTETGLDPIEATKDELFKKAKSLKLKPAKYLGKGRLMDLLFKQVVRPSLIQPCFLINLPVAVSPLAKIKAARPAVAERLIIMAGGTELGNGYSELNDPLEQKKRFEEQRQLREAGDEEAQMYDRDYIEALEYGMPPTAGFGMSERLFAFLMDKPMRECVLFPLMKEK